MQKLSILNPKYERIEKTLNRLQNSSATMSELADELGVSTKTIQRDFKDILVKYGVIRAGRELLIDPNFVDSSLSLTEKTILGILDELAKSGGSEFYHKAHILLSQAGQQLEHPIYAYQRHEKLEYENLVNFATLEEAIATKLQISFLFKTKNFDVKPLKLAFFDGFWYLLALDINSKDTFKKFHLKSIEDIKISSIQFKIKSSIDEKLKKANSVWFQLTNPFEIKLLVDKDFVVYFDRKPLLGQSTTGKDADGSVEITLEITHEMEIIPLILSYIPYVRILEPQWLADEFKEKLEQYLQTI